MPDYRVTVEATIRDRAVFRIAASTPDSAAAEAKDLATEGFLLELLPPGGVSVEIVDIEEFGPTENDNA